MSEKYLKVLRYFKNIPFNIKIVLGMNILLCSVFGYATGMQMNLHPAIFIFLCNALFLFVVFQKITVFRTTENQQFFFVDAFLVRASGYIAIMILVGSGIDFILFEYHSTRGIFASLGIAVAIFIFHNMRIDRLIENTFPKHLVSRMTLDEFLDIEKLYVILCQKNAVEPQKLSFIIFPDNILATEINISIGASGHSNDCLFYIQKSMDAVLKHHRGKILPDFRASKNHFSVLVEDAIQGKELSFHEQVDFIGKHPDYGCIIEKG